MDSEGKSNVATTNINIMKLGDGKRLISGDSNDGGDIF